MAVLKFFFSGHYLYLTLIWNQHCSNPEFWIDLQLTSEFPQLLLFVTQLMLNGLKWVSLSLLQFSAYILMLVEEFISSLMRLIGLFLEALWSLCSLVVVIPWNSLAWRSKSISKILLGQMTNRNLALIRFLASFFLHPHQLARGNLFHNSLLSCCKDLTTQSMSALNDNKNTQEMENG